MSTLQIIILAIIQGITEFFPISSSAHLILLPKLLGWQDQGLAIDVAVHLGTLGGVIIYFWRDVLALTKGGISMLSGRFTPDNRPTFMLIIATIPVVIVGFLMHDLLAVAGRNPLLIALTTLGFGILLYGADHLSTHSKSIKRLRTHEAFLVGCAQAIAIIPGVSRAGACITALRLAGFKRQDCAYYSCIMSMPTILAAAVLVGYKLYQAHAWVALQTFFIAAGLSLVFSLIAIHFMMSWVQRFSYNIFVLYRLVLGGGILLVLYGAHLLN